MVHFGVAGNSESFYQEGGKTSAQAPAWLSGKGLDAYEYAAGHGLTIGEATARQIGKNAQEHGITVSVHAPYYINCASEEEEKRDNSVNYLLASARAADWMGAQRVIFHVGSPGKQKREKALVHAEETIARAYRAIDEAGLSHIVLCPETMGRPSQIGTLEETLAFCRLDARMIPTLDFAHLHAIGQGAIKGAEDFRRILETMVLALGQERAKHFHSHFSKVAYTAKGERMHVTFADAGYGPDFDVLAPLLVEMQLEPTVICESRGTQAEDAKTMKTRYMAELSVSAR